MALPFFYISDYKPDQPLVMDEDTSRHIVQVLRMKTGEELNLTDGKGNLLTGIITGEHKKNCTVSVKNVRYTPSARRKISVAISLLKNANRFEWFLEKATEIGVREVIPLICDRTEKEKFRFDRMQAICISAMLQSQQTWLPVLREPAPFSDLKNWKGTDGINLIAHCAESGKQAISQLQIHPAGSCLICIGPEGDFTLQEIKTALEEGFQPVSLGETRLRTETAGIVAVTLLALS